MASKDPTDAKQKPKKTAKITAAEEEKNLKTTGRKGKAKAGKATSTPQGPINDGNGTDADEDDDGIKIE